MKEVIIATQNHGKAKEFVALFEPLGITVKTLLDYPDIPEIEETGETFAENAILKAETISKLVNKPVIADDSGLMIDFLGGKPGVYSARYAGEEKSDKRNIEKVLAELENVPYSQRSARFQCTLAISIPGKSPVLFEGNCEGIILTEERGENGFGYDPIFYVPSLDKTFAELSGEEKNSVSHRGKAIKKLKKWINTSGERIFQ